MSSRKMPLNAIPVTQASFFHQSSFNLQRRCRPSPLRHPNQYDAEPTVLQRHGTLPAAALSPESQQVGVEVAAVEQDSSDWVPQLFKTTCKEQSISSHPNIHSSN